MPLLENTSGLSATDNGDFASDFVVSAIAEEGPDARIRAYFYDGENDGSLSLEEVTIADSIEVSDSSGPDISLSFEGGSTSVLPGDELEVRLSDENGINLVNRVVPRDKLLDTAEKMARKIASYDPMAVLYAKQAVVRGADMTLAEGLNLEKMLKSRLAARVNPK